MLEGQLVKGDNCGYLEEIEAGLSAEKEGVRQLLGSGLEKSRKICFYSFCIFYLERILAIQSCKLETRELSHSILALI